MRRRGILVGGIVAIAVVAVAAIVLVASDDDDGGVVLEPAASMSPGAFFDDLDLYPAEERALAEPPAADAFDAFAEPDKPVALAGRTLWAFEPGAYAGTHDRPPCDLEALADLVGEDGQVDAATVDAWFAAFGDDIREDQRDDYVDDLTPVRLRFDARVTSYRWEEQEAVAVQSLLQAGTAVLVDESGSPRVRCAGGHPLDDPEPAPDLGGDAALDLEELAENPDEAWDGLDPALVVVIQGSSSREHLDLAAADGSLFRRRSGSDGTRDQTLLTAEEQAAQDAEFEAERCAAGCFTLEITIQAASGSRGVVAFREGEQLITTPGPQPTTVEGGRVAWEDGAALPGTYGVTVTHEDELLRYLTPEEEDNLGDEALTLALLNNPDVEGETITIEPASLDPNGNLVPTHLRQCVPGEVTVTFIVDGVVAQASTQHVNCELGEAQAFEFTLG